MLIIEYLPVREAGDIDYIFNVIFRVASKNFCATGEDHDNHVLISWLGTEARSLCADLTLVSAARIQGEVCEDHKFSSGSSTL